jgi:enoyl-CoA hydratase/carnithine racemase
MQAVQVKEEDGVLYLTISRPDKKNALTREMYLTLANAINYAEHDSANKVIVISGAGGVFCAGNDMHDFLSAASLEENDVSETEQFMRALLDCKLPVIAQVDGLAIGIGCTLLLHCDFVYASERSAFKMPFVNLGLVPEYASSYVLPRLCGHVKAAELLMLGKTFDSEEAYRLGMINAVVDHADLFEEVTQVAKQLSSLPTNAVLQTKALLKANNEAVKDHMYTELALFVKAMSSAEAQAAFKAFVAR